MILARFWDLDGAAHDYPDIWDVSIDAEIATGVDFFQQEGRQASFSLKADGWLTRALVDPIEVVSKRYLPIYIEIIRDGVAIFGGFTQVGNQVEQHPRRTLITVTLYDPICVMVDMNAEAEREVEAGHSYNVMDELREVIPVAMENCAELFDPFGVSWLDSWAASGLGMEFLIWLQRWDSREDVEPSSYDDVVERRLTLHQVGSEWWVEWIDCTKTLVHETHFGSLHIFRLQQHLVWLRLKLFNYGTNLNTGVAQVNQTSTHAITVSDPSTDETYLLTLIQDWLVTVPDIRAGYSIPAANETLAVEIDGAQWRIANVIDGEVVTGVASSTVDAAMLQKLVDPAEEFVVDDDTDSVGLMTWLGGLLRIVCGWLQVSGRTVELKNRLDYPGSVITEIGDAILVEPVRMTGMESVQVSADFDFLKDGDDVAAGVQEFYEETILGAMPKEFELMVTGRDWSVGQTVSWRGWIIMITSVEKDLLRSVSRLRGMGGRG